MVSSDNPCPPSPCPPPVKGGGINIAPSPPPFIKDGEGPGEGGFETVVSDETTERKAEINDELWEKA